jgi:hypothetical protein
VTEPLLQRQFPHAVLPHGRGVGMPERGPPVVCETHARGKFLDRFRATRAAVDQADAVGILCLLLMPPRAGVFDCVPSSGGRPTHCGISP